MFTFQILSDKIDQNTNLAKLPSGKMAFFDITGNFIIKKLKSKHFSGDMFFEGTRENILHIFRALRI